MGSPRSMHFHDFTLALTLYLVCIDAVVVKLPIWFITIRAVVDRHSESFLGRAYLDVYDTNGEQWIIT